MTLSQREIEVLQLVADGRTNREIGQAMWLTTATVKYHLKGIYRKLGVHNRLAAVRAWEHDQLAPPTVRASEEPETTTHEVDYGAVKSPALPAAAGYPSIHAIELEARIRRLEEVVKVLARAIGSDLRERNGSAPVPQIPVEM